MTDGIYNGRDLALVLFAVWAVWMIAMFGYAAWRESKALKREWRACGRIARQTRIGVHERLGGDEIAQRRR